MGEGGCLCQWELKAPTDRSRSDCVHEQVAKRIANVRFTPIDSGEYKGYNYDRKNKNGQNVLEVITWRLLNRKMK